MPLAQQTRIVAFVRSNEERLAVRVAFAEHTMVSCRTASEVARAAAEGQNILVWELAICGELDLATVHTVARLPSVRAVILRIDLTRAAAQQVLKITTMLPAARISVRGHDELPHDVSAALRETEPISSTAMIAHRVLPHVRQGVASDLVAAAIVVTRRKITVGRFATLCHIPMRTLEWTLKRAKLAPARRLLGYFLTVHSMWLLDVLRWPPKRIAFAIGFESRQAWAAYLARHAGGSPTRLKQEGGFAALLEAWDTQLRLEPAPRPTPRL